MFTSNPKWRSWSAPGLLFDGNEIEEQGARHPNAREAVFAAVSRFPANGRRRPAITLAAALKLPPDYCLMAMR